MSHLFSQRIQVTINPVLVDWAKGLMQTRGYDSLSEFLESLIREEQERRGSPAVIRDSSLSPAPAQPMAKPVTYRRAKSKPNTRPL